MREITPSLARLPDVAYDRVGRELKVGGSVAKASSSGRSAVLDLRRIAKVEGDSVWTTDFDDGNTRAYKLHYNDRVVIIDY